MKIIIFAGGIGKRLWPLSRKGTPKQFQKLFGDETSLENSFNTIKEQFDVKDIYISTNQAFAKQVLDVIPNLPKENIIVEPESRDTGPAVAYAMHYISKKFPEEPVVIRWQNSLIKDPQAFQNALADANEVFINNEAEFVYLSVPAKYANIGVGYIQMGEKLRETKDSLGLFSFKNFTEKPEVKLAQEYVDDGNYGWNPGCYITTPQYVLNQLKKANQEFYELLINDEFEKLEKISIDFLLWEHLDPQGVKVVLADYDWHYVSTWADLKKALQSGDEENVIKGKVVSFETTDSLIFNYDEKLVAGVGLEGIEIINTPTALLVVKKEKAGDVKKLLQKLEDEGMEEYL